MARIQFNIQDQMCDKTITFSIYYGEHNIWNNTDAPKILEWRKHVEQGHNVSGAYIFYP